MAWVTFNIEPTKLIRFRVLLLCCNLWEKSSVPGMDSKILVAVELLVLVCLFSLESASCSTKGFQITRDSRDSFKIPPSKCDSTNQSFDYCAEYNAKKDREKTPCDCVCDASSSTFEFRNNAWSCQKNNETRASFG